MNDLPPKLSVIVPTYNMARFLPECISTIAKQNYPNLELIIVDGASTDNTLSIIKRYSKIITKFVSEKDRGQPEAVTKGLRMATGEIVHWHAADDIVLPNAFKRIISEFQQHPDIDLVFSDGLAFTEKAVTRGAHVRWVNFVDTVLFFGRFQSDCAYWRHNITEKALPLADDKQLTCDEDFFLRMWVGRSYKWINQPLGAFRSHGDQISQHLDRSTVWIERMDTRRQVLEHLGWTEQHIRKLRQRRLLVNWFCNHFAVKSCHGTRFILRKLTFDILRKRYTRFILNDWVRPLY